MELLEKRAKKTYQNPSIEVIITRIETNIMSLPGTDPIGEEED